MGDGLLWKLASLCVTTYVVTVVIMLAVGARLSGIG
jgi:hypothetical protein